MLEPAAGQGVESAVRLTVHERRREAAEGTGGGALPEQHPRNGQPWALRIDMSAGGESVAIPGRGDGRDGPPVNPAVGIGEGPRLDPQMLLEIAMRSAQLLHGPLRALAGEERVGPGVGSDRQTGAPHDAELLPGQRAPLAPIRRVDPESVLETIEQPGQLGLRQRFEKAADGVVIAARRRPATLEGGRENIEPGKLEPDPAVEMLQIERGLSP